MVESGIMNLVPTLVLVSSMVIIGHSTTSETDCSFTDLDLGGALTSVITQLSKHEQQMSDGISPYVDLLDIQCCNMSGLRLLRQYGPLLHYCVNGTRKFQVDLVHNGSIEVIMSWTLYNGDKGTLTVGAELSRFTLQFVVLEQPPEKTIALRLEYPLVPVATKMTYATVEGVGETVRAATELWSNLWPSVTQRVWNEYFLEYLRRAICDAQRDLFVPPVQATSQETTTSSSAFTVLTELDACSY